jgi:hypothetical protein
MGMIKAGTPQEPGSEGTAKTDRQETQPGGYHSWVHLATDYIHPTPRDGRCRVRVYLPEDERDAPVVVCSELPTNEGSSITYAAEQLAAEVIRYHRLPTPVVWVEHHPPITTDGSTETFDLVTFAGYEVRERGPYLGETRLTVGEATWKRITRGMVEVLVGGEV